MRLICNWGSKAEARTELPSTLTLISTVATCLAGNRKQQIETDSQTVPLPLLVATNFIIIIIFFSNDLVLQNRVNRVFFGLGTPDPFMWFMF